MASRQNRSFPPETAHLLIVWLALLALGAAQFGLSFLIRDRTARPLIMLPATAMIAVVAMGFMNVTKGPTITRTFAVAALLWLLILLGLGSVDAFTRINYAVPGGADNRDASQVFGGTSVAVIGHPPDRSGAHRGRFGGASDLSFLAPVERPHVRLPTKV